MDSQTNRHFSNIFFLILTFFSIQLFNENIFNAQQTTLNINKSDLISFEQFNYSDDLEVDTSFDLQKRKIFDIDIINIINTSNIFVSLLKKEKSISLDSYFTINLYKLSNPRAPPLS
jgi:hypothetical protein